MTLSARADAKIRGPSHRSAIADIAAFETAYVAALRIGQCDLPTPLCATRQPTRLLGCDPRARLLSLTLDVKRSPRPLPRAIEHRTSTEQTGRAARADAQQDSPSIGDRSSSRTRPGYRRTAATVSRREAHDQEPMAAFQNPITTRAAYSQQPPLERATSPSLRARARPPPPRALLSPTPTKNARRHAGRPGEVCYDLIRGELRACDGFAYSSLVLRLGQ